MVMKKKQKLRICSKQSKAVVTAKGFDINSSKGLILSETDTKTLYSGRIIFQPASAQQIKLASNITIQDGYLSPAARITKNWLKANPVLYKDRPIPSFLNRFYFEVNVENTDGSSLTVEKLSDFLLACGLGIGTICG